MSFLIAAVIMIALCAVLTLFMGKKDPKKGNGTKNKAQILKEANKRLAKNPHDPLGLIPLGEIYFESQLWDKAYKVYSDLVKLALANKDGTIDLYTSFLRQGITALKLEKLPEATQSLVNATKMNSVAYESNYYLGQTMNKLQLWDKAIPLFKKALLANPEATEIYLQLGQCYYNAKKYRDSLPCFKKALDEDPGNKEALFHMADAMANEGHPEKAIKVFMHLRADSTYGPRSCLQAGQFHMKTNDLNSAMNDFEIGLKHESTPPEIKIELEYNLARCYFERNMIPKGLMMLKSIRAKNANYKDVNTLISRYQELSQNSNLQIYISSNSSDFVTLCRKFIMTKYRNSTVKIQSIDVDVLYVDILAEIYSSKWEDVALFRFFRTTGATGEIYVREFHGHMSDVKAARGFCISAGTFTEEARKYIEGRPIDLIEKNDLTKILKQITI
ncbi:MAG: tetratricopeptide repeat protein [Treponema sp.]|nr:tetratricopeptide repeat protein [Candidatus Treponema equi]